MGRRGSRIAASLPGTLLVRTDITDGVAVEVRAISSRGPDLRVAHEALSLATLAALVVHGATLLGDSYLHPSIADVTVPFLSGYETLWTSMGIIAFWGLALLGPSYYLRRLIGAIQQDGGSPLLEAIVDELVTVPDVATLNKAYEAVGGNGVVNAGEGVDGVGNDVTDLLITG